MFNVFLILELEVVLLLGINLWTAFYGLLFFLSGSHGLRKLMLNWTHSQGVMSYVTLPSLKRRKLKTTWVSLDRLHLTFAYFKFHLQGKLLHELSCLIASVPADIAEMNYTKPCCDGLHWCTRHSMLLWLQYWKASRYLCCFSPYSPGTFSALSEVYLWCLSSCFVGTVLLTSSPVPESRTVVVSVSQQVYMLQTSASVHESSPPPYIG